ncbi:hypothetical protein AYO44_13630 [Planctomycetaceae bacterium SCGC AG-212-F19]|nr:hypothetical protein AYO44_13630 [Planctomycetaceae bacterium SCGC AG-212-F19]
MPSEFLLIITDTPAQADRLAQALAQNAGPPCHSCTPAQAAHLIRQNPPLTVVLDACRHEAGVAFARTLRAQFQDVPLVLLVEPNFDMADFPGGIAAPVAVISQPFGPAELRQAIDTVLAQRAAPLTKQPSVLTSDKPLAAGGTEPSNPAAPTRLLTWLVRAALGAVGLVFVAAIVLPALGLPGLREWWKADSGKSSSAEDRKPTAQLVSDRADALRVPLNVVRRLEIQTAEVRPAREPRTLLLPGSLAVSSNRLARVHARFAGEVAEIGHTTVPAEEGARTSKFRPVDGGDRVTKGQLLAVVFSKDLGEKKSELVDSLSRLQLDQDTLRRLEELFQKNAIPERSLREQQRTVEADRIAVDRVERTLRSWRLTNAEIEALRLEARQLGTPQAAKGAAHFADWARVEVRAPFDGVILERNLALGDIIDTTNDLFKIADLTELTVWAHIYEEDLPLLLAQPRPITWHIRVQADPTIPPQAGTVEYVGEIIDPNQHTALVSGLLPNPGRRFRAGQFIEATVAVPPPPGVLAIPASALLEDGWECVVFVQPVADEPVYELRPVVVDWRERDVVHIAPRGGKRGQPAAAGAALRPGDRVVTAGAVELRQALEDLRATGKR